MSDDRLYVGKRLFLVILPFACYGLVSVDGKITAAPPIAKFLIGRHLSTACSYVGTKHGTITEVVTA